MTRRRPRRDSDWLILLAVHFGGFFGMATAPSCGLLVIVLRERAAGRAAGFDEAISPWAWTCPLAGAFVAGIVPGAVGAAVALKIRRHRHADWPEARTHFLGAYAGAAVAGAALTAAAAVSSLG